MPKKPKIHKDIQAAGDGLAILMRNKLTVIADDLIKRLMKKSKQLTPARKLEAIKDLNPKWIQDYKAAVKNAMSVIALDAIDKVRSEVPMKKKIQLVEQFESVQLDEFSRLPKDLQRKLKLKTDLLVDKQIGDLQKVIEFAYATAEEETDSSDLIESDINDSAIGWLNGTAVETGASLNASSVINSARQAYFFDDQVLEEVEAFEFVNGDPVTEICQDLAGTIFSKDDAGADRYQPPLHWNAILNNSLIQTIDGPRPIATLSVGERVLTHKNRYRPVTEVMSKFEDKEYFEIVLENGKHLNITAEHPVLTERGWIPAGQLTISDEVICLEDIKKG